MDEASITIAQTMTEVAPELVKRASAKRYITAALSAGFEVRCGITKTVEHRAPFKSVENAGKPRPDVEAEHLWIIARVPRRARFKLHFKGGSFSEGWVWDAAGWPTELWYDYTPSANDIRQSKDETEKSWKQRTAELQRDVERREATYNDGEFWTNQNMRLVTTSGDLDEWMADLVPGFTVRKKAVRMSQAEVDEQFSQLVEGEWIG